MLLAHFLMLWLFTPSTALDSPVRCRGSRNSARGSEARVPSQRQSTGHSDLCGLILKLTEAFQKGSLGEVASLSPPQGSTYLQLSILQSFKCLSTIHLHLAGLQGPK